MTASQAKFKLRQIPETFTTSHIVQALCDVGLHVHAKFGEAGNEVYLQRKMNELPLERRGELSRILSETQRRRVDIQVTLMKHLNHIADKLAESQDVDNLPFLKEQHHWLYTILLSNNPHIDYTSAVPSPRGKAFTRLKLTTSLAVQAVRLTYLDMSARATHEDVITRENHLRDGQLQHEKLFVENDNSTSHAEVSLLNLQHLESRFLVAQARLKAIIQEMRQELEDLELVLQLLVPHGNCKKLVSLINDFKADISRELRFRSMDMERDTIIDQFNRCSGKVARFRKVRILARALRIV